MLIRRHSTAKNLLLQFRGRNELVLPCGRNNLVPLFRGRNWLVLLFLLAFLGFELMPGSIVGDALQFQLITARIQFDALFF